MNLGSKIFAISYFLSCGCVSSQNDVAASLPVTSFRHELGVREPVQYVSLDNVRLTYSDPDSRSSLPIVIGLHAIGHGGRDFEAVQKHFAGKYRFITLDWPGQGYSESDPDSASVVRYSKLFAKFIEQQKLENFVILGNSVGGGVAIKYASENPNKVRALLLSNPAGIDEGGFFAKIFIWWIVRKMHAGSEQVDSFYDWFKEYYHKVLITDEAALERERIVASGFEIAPILEQAWQSFGQPDGDLRALIPKIQMPVLFAWAKKDQYVQWSRCRGAVEKFSNKKVEFFEAGHAPFLETPAAFNTAAEHFLNTLGNP